MIKKLKDTDFIMMGGIKRDLTCLFWSKNKNRGCRDDDLDNDDDIYIMIRCVFVTKNHHYPLPS